jgi:hypothetical protein
MSGTIGATVRGSNKKQGGLNGRGCSQGAVTESHA